MSKCKICSFTTEDRFSPQTALASLLYETQKMKFVQRGKPNILIVHLFSVLSGHTYI